jgi:PQQ-like domain
MRLRGATFGTLAIAFFRPAIAPGQMVDIPRPRTLTVGTPVGGARTERVDCARTGRTRTVLPSSGLHTAWRTPLGTLVEHGPLVDQRSNIYVVGTRGDVIALGRDGAERWRLATGAAQPGPATLLADDTLVFVDASGEAIAVRDAAVKWRVRFGRSAVAHPAPLPLDDGGVVVATTHDLIVLDAEGHERARTTLREPTTLPLLAARGQVIAVTTSGAVWSWPPGSVEPMRIASFGSPVNEGAVLADDHTLVAVTAGQIHLTAVDLLLRATTTRAVVSTGMLFGPPAARQSTTYLVLVTPTSELAIAIDASGVERFRALLASHPPPVGADGGPSMPPVAAHTAPLVDRAGALAFATADGSIGVTNGAVVELLGEKCEPPVGGAARGTPPVAGLAPLEDGALVAVCHAGAVVAIGGRAR